MGRIWFWWLKIGLGLSDNRYEGRAWKMFPVIFAVLATTATDSRTGGERTLPAGAPSDLHEHYPDVSRFGHYHRSPWFLAGGCDGSCGILDQAPAGGGSDDATFSNRISGLQNAREGLNPVYSLKFAKNQVEAPLGRF
jgi:hypothetical protein